MFGQKSLPRSVPPNRQLREVIEGGTLEAPVVDKKPARLDQVYLHREAGGEPQQGAGVLRYVRLEQGEAQTSS
jgi:hypothetical protein